MEAAEASGILKIVGNKLAPLLIKEYSSIVGAKNDLKELHGQVVEINRWLESVGDKAVGIVPSFYWLKRLKNIAYEVDDIVDEFQLKAEKHDASGDGGMVSKYLWDKPKSIIFKFKVAAKIKAIKIKFAAVVEQRNDFNTIAVSLPVGHPARHMAMTVGDMPLLTRIDAASVLGRDKDKHELISKLVEVKDQQTINIVSIIGLGGLGKTTLAKLVFNDDNIIDKHFEVKLWVHVSQEFDVAKLVRKLFEALSGEKSEHYPLQPMRERILDNLTKKRYLLVLDDVWTKDQTLWDQFMVFLKSGTPGSAILLTMRSSEVAGTVRSTYQFSLPFLSLDDSWQLFRQSLGMHTKHLEVSEFVEVGEDILNKCGGVPLAIKVVAGVLRDKELIGQWKDMRDSNLLDVEGKETIVSQCLRLSYSHLPSHIKQCFKICSVFPKGYMIDKEKLIDLWIAHDMITPEIGVEYLEDIGHKCFNSLLQMSFLQVMRKEYKEYERVTYTMPNLIHDLARSIMGEEISLNVPEVATSSTKSFRYFSITEWPLNLPPDNIFEEARAMYVAKGEHFKFGRAFQNVKYLRSITVEYTESISTTIFRVTNLRYLEISGLKCDVLPEAISDIWSLQVLHVTYCDILNLPKSIGNLQKLRTLNLSWCKRLKSLPGSVSNCHMISNLNLSGCIEFEVLPDFIGTYKRLRMLRMSHTKIKRLPSSVTSLGNLECLYLQHCSELVELPEGLGNLKKLEILSLEGCPKLRVMLGDIGQIGRHQNVNIFIVGENEKRAKISELRNINGITYVMKPGDEQKACLEEKTGLQRLQLHWGRSDMHKETNLQTVFDGLVPPSRIKELYVGGYAGGRCAQWMLKQVDGRVKGLSEFLLLTVMTLCGLPNLEHLDGLVGLPGLEELDLRWMPSLKSISGGPFPSLVKLRMEGLRSMEEVWMITEGNLTDGKEGQMQIGICLSKLHIEECPKLKVKPYFPSSLEHLVFHRSNEQLLLSSGQGQGPSSSSSFPATSRYSNLKKLELWGMTSSSSSPLPGSASERGWELLQHMSSLESLKISQCGSLSELPNSMRSLTSLRSLFINFCSAIRMLPEWLGELCSLQKMTIQSCHSLSGLPRSIVNLTPLQELQIERCDEFYQLPEHLGRLRYLRKFYIASLQGLNYLPNSMCRSLEELEISDCPGLTSLPEWIRDLPALQKLKITGCPELGRRCEREKGEDWHLISHIPYPQIGFDEEGSAC